MSSFQGSEQPWPWDRSSRPAIIFHLGGLRKQLPILFWASLPSFSLIPPPPTSCKVICRAAFLKGKVICWNLSQTISKIELPKVIGHIFMETDALFPNTAITCVHSISQIIFYWAKKTRAANVKDEMTCFIYFCKCYGQRETMIGLHTPQEAQHSTFCQIPRGWSLRGFVGPFLLPRDRKSVV